MLRTRCATAATAGLSATAVLGRGVEAVLRGTAVAAGATATTGGVPGAIATGGARAAATTRAVRVEAR